MFDTTECDRSLIGKPFDCGRQCFSACSHRENKESAGEARGTRTSRQQTAASIPLVQPSTKSETLFSKSFLNFFPLRSFPPPYPPIIALTIRPMCYELPKKTTHQHRPIVAFHYFLFCFHEFFLHHTNLSVPPSSLPSTDKNHLDFWRRFPSDTVRQGNHVWNEYNHQKVDDVCVCVCV